MLLTVREVAKLLATPEKKIYRWVDDGEIPFHKVNDQIRFHRAELLEWATAKKLPVSVEMFQDEDEDRTSLSRSIELGGIHWNVAGSDGQSAMRAVVGLMPLPEDVDREFLLDVLLAREALGSTGIGDGIAIPHVRSPMVLSGAPSMITVCFLERPIEFGAVDGQPVHTIFSIVTPTIKGHLQLLARLTRALLDQGFRAAITRRATAEEILAEARRVEKTFPRSEAEG
jgi:PTS system nitrogen regulatory IIA component